MSTLMQPVDNETQQFEIIEEEENTYHDELKTVLGELGVEGSDDIMLKVYKITELGKEAHIFDSLPEAITGIEERLRNSYGKGDYKIKVFAPTPNGGKSVKKHIKLSIEVPNENEIIPVDNSGDDLKTVVSSMMDAMQKNSKDMMQMFQTSQLESQNSMLKFMMESGNKKDEQPSMLELMRTVKEMMPEPAKQPDAMSMLTQMMDMHRSVKDEFSEDKPASGDTMGQLLQGMNGLVDLAKNAPQQPAIPSTTSTPAIPNASPQTTRPDSSMNQNGQIPSIHAHKPENQDMNVLVKMQISKHLNFLLEKAAQNKNVDVYADLTIEEIPEKFYPQLLSALGENDEQGFNNLMSINPAIEPYKQWFTDFCGSIRSFFSEINADNTDENLTDTDNSGDDGLSIQETDDIKQNNADKSGEQIPSESNKDNS